MQRREALHTRRNSHRSEASMSRRWKRPAVIHRRTDRDTRRHLVIDEAAHPLPEQWFEGGMIRIILSSRVRIDGAGEIAFEIPEQVGGLFRIARQDEQGHRAERFGLQGLRVS